MVRLQRCCAFLGLLTLIGCTAPVPTPTPDAGRRRFAPGAPTDVVALAGDAQVTLTWVAPADSGTDPITRYTITRIPGGETKATTTLSVTLTGLTNGTAYTFTVHATSAAGDGIESLPSAPVTPLAAVVTPPEAPTSVLAVPGDGLVTLGWQPPAHDGGRPVSEYTVTTYPGGTHTTTTVTSAIITGLRNGDAYTFTVHATNAIGSSPESEPTSPVIPRAPKRAPGVPTEVVASPGNAQATVSWTAPGDDGDSAITGYTVTSNPGGLRATTTGATSVVVSGMMNGLAYTFTVHATNAIGSSSESAASNQVTPATTPGAPGNVIASPGDGQVTLSWQPPLDDGGSAISGYVVRAANSTDELTTTDTTLVVPGLTNGTSYQFVVLAQNELGTGPPASSNSVVPAAPLLVPGTPTGVHATRGNGSAFVSWSAPMSDGGSPITGYTVRALPAGPSVTTTGATHVTVTGLANGTPCRFTVHATNAVGNSEESEASFPITPATVPEAPARLFVAAGNASATVSWTVPVGDGGSPITGYVVTVSPGGAQISVSGTSTVVPGLTNGESYTFTVHAVNDVGDGAESDASRAVYPASTPGAPTEVTALAGDASARISWTAPEDIGGSALTGFVLTASPGGATLAVGVQTSATMMGLANGTTYTFTVRARNALGAGVASSPSNEVTPVAAPQLPGAPTNVVAVAGHGSARVGWTPPDSDGRSPILDYVVTTYPGGRTTTVSELTATIDGLTNGQSYTFTVAARNALGIGPESAPSQAVVPLDVPGSPGLVVAEIQDGLVTVHWLAPYDDGGSPVTAFTITASPSGVTVTSFFTGTFFSNLPNGIAQTFTVHATNALGDGPDSAPSNAVTPTTWPSAPTIVSVVPGDGSVTVSWTAPVDDGGSVITGYSVSGAPGGFAETTGDTSATVTGLANGTSYVFTVSAFNAAGTGPASEPSSPVSPRGAPRAPAAVTAVPHDGSATVSWDVPNDGGAAITGYMVIAIPGGNTVSTDNTRVEMTGLTNGTRYTFVVHATNEAGDGADSFPSNAVTPAKVPGAPRFVTAASSSGQASLTWSAPVDDGGSTITAYIATATPGGLTATYSAGARSGAFSGLTYGTGYTFTLQAVNAIGIGAASIPTQTFYPGAYIPGAPTNISVAAGYGEVLVQWDPPTDNGGAPILSYFVEAQPGPRFAYVAGTETSAAVTNLDNGRTYTFSVYAINAIGSGLTSVNSVPVTPGATPGAPLNVIAVAGSHQALLSWEAPLDDGGAPIQGYMVTVLPEGRVLTSGLTTLLVSGLINGSSYTFTVRAVTAVGAGRDSDPSNAVTPVGQPGPPHVLSIEPGDRRITVTFSPPDDDGQSPITSYVVTASPGSASVVLPINETTGSTGPFAVEIPGLENGTAYRITVLANNAGGPGVASRPSEPVTPVKPTTVPGTPILSSTWEHAAQELTLHWEAPASDGGSAITGYTITLLPGPVVATTLGELSVKITGLTNGMAYTATVHATNAVGDGPESGSLSELIPGRIPNAPGQVVAAPGDGEAVVFWTQPYNGGFAITEYIVNVMPGDLTYTFPVATSGRIPNLTNAVTYTFTVSAVNSEGPSHLSQPATATPSGVPGAPTDVIAVAGDGSATVSWTAAFANGSAVTGYTVTSSDGQTATTTGALSATVTGLTNGTSYTFTVVATNAVGDGAVSEASNAVVPMGLPGAPRNVVATAGSAEATITWESPVDPGGAATLTYTVTSEPDGIVVTTDLTSATVTGLAPGTSYTFTVHATNAAGDGPESDPSNAVVVDP